MSGIDMLVKSVMQAAGIDPERVKAEIQEYGQQLARKIESMDRSMVELRLKQDLMYELLLNISLKDRASPESARLGVPIAAATPAIAAAPNGGKRA